MPTPNTSYSNTFRAGSVIALFVTMLACGPTIIIIDDDEFGDDGYVDSTELNTATGAGGDVAGCEPGMLGCECMLDGTCTDGLMCNEVGTCYAGIPCGDVPCVEGYGCTLADTCIDCYFTHGVYGCPCNISGECEGSSVCEDDMCGEY